MNKLLLTLTVLACAMGSHAQDAGDFVYTKDGRFKIADGVNMLQNGDFGQGTQHWTTDGQTPLNPDTFYVDNLGPDGGPCLVANKKDNGPGTGCSLMQKVEVKQGRTYYITYSVAAGEEVTTTTTGGSGVKNYQNIFFNTDGSATPQQPIATSKSYGLDWTKIEYSFTAPENGYVVFHFYGSYVGTTFDDFKVLAANKAVDDREANAIIESHNGYLSNPLLPNGHDILEGFIGDLRLYVEQNDLDSYNGMLGFLDECVALFLDENSVNITGHVKCPDFDETSVSLGKDVTNVGGPDGWQAWGGRWTQRDITAPFTSIWMKREIDGKYILEQGGLYQVMENMPAGQYMFSLKVRAAKYKNKNNDIDYDCDLRGLKIFINEDSVEMHPIHTERLTTYSAFHKLDQPGTVTIGIYIPDSVCNRVDLDNADLRIIGATQEDIDDYFAQRETQAARQQLAEAIGTAGQLLGSELYLYGKDNLRDSIAAAQQAHDTAADTETLVAAKADLDSAMTHFKDINKAYTALVGDIANAEAQLSDPAYTEGRDALQQAISQGFRRRAHHRALGKDRPGHSRAGQGPERGRQRVCGCQHPRRRKIHLAQLGPKRRGLIYADPRLGQPAHHELRSHDVCRDGPVRRQRPARTHSLQREGAARTRPQPWPERELPGQELYGDVGAQPQGRRPSDHRLQHGQQRPQRIYNLGQRMVLRCLRQQEAA